MQCTPSLFLLRRASLITVWRVTSTEGTYFAMAIKQRPGTPRLAWRHLGLLMLPQPARLLMMVLVLPLARASRLTGRTLSLQWRPLLPDTWQIKTIGTWIRQDMMLEKATAKASIRIQRMG